MTNTAPTIEGKAERIPELTVGESFRRFARGSADFAGSAVTFFSAAAIILLWALVGPYFQYSDSWQLVINTATTIITFLMVFLIQNTQNRDAEKSILNLMSSSDRMPKREINSSVWKSSPIRNSRYSQSGF